MEIKTAKARTNFRCSKFAIYAWGVLAYNVLVVLWGAYVRATGSGAGCGNHWPMCNGEVLPVAPKLATLIEFTHRASSGVALIAIVGLIIWAYRAYPRQHAVRLGATLSGVFILTEALIGAGLVLLQHVAQNASLARAWSLSLHLINTFTLLAVLTLTAYWASGGASFPARSLTPSLPMLAGLMILGVSGAITALGDTLFPALSWKAALAQDFSPAAHVFLRLRVFHPAIAIVVSALAALFVIRTMRRYTDSRLQNFGAAVLVLMTGQLILGAMNIALLAPVAMQLIHLAAADAVWIAAVLFAATAAALPESQALPKAA